MIISQHTFDVLENFQTINPSILIRPGNVIKTIASTESVFAEAVVPDTFPKEFCIYDVSRFLGLLSLNKDSDVSFFDNHLVITQGNSKIKYTYCNPQLIVSPPEKQIKVGETYVKFRLHNEVLKSAFKAMQILGYNELAFTGENGVLSITVLNTKNSSSDLYSTEIGETDKTFSAIIEADKLKIMKHDYEVAISEKSLCHLKSVVEENPTQYWIALSSKSEFR